MGAWLVVVRGTLTPALSQRERVRGRCTPEEEEKRKKGQGASAKAGGRSRMKESYKVRPSQPPWPRVMRSTGQPAGRSVHRGTAGLCIELRKHFFAEADPILSRGRQQ